MPFRIPIPMQTETCIQIAGLKSIRHRSGRRQQRGLALLTAILYVTLASILAVSLVSSQQLEIRRSGNMIDRDRALIFAYGVEGWVKQILTRDDPDKDSLDDDWAMVLPPIPVDDGQVAGRIFDLQGRFNVNNLVNQGQVEPKQLEIFQRLLEALGLEPGIASAVVDWIDPDQNTTFPDGAEDDVYTGLPQPYRTANQPLVSATELMLIKNITAEVYAVLAPHVVALPEITPINVNTATAPVIAALAPGLTIEDGEALVESRQEEVFDSVANFNKFDLLQGKDIQSVIALLSVNSSYFLMDGNTRYGDRGKMHLYTVLARKGGKVSVVMRSFGVF